MTGLNDIASQLNPAPRGQPTPVSGGCIHQSYHWDQYFIKTNSVDQFSNFQAEAAGLEAIATTGTIRVPEVIYKGIQGNTAYLVLEWLDLQPAGNDSLLGEQLAGLHQSTNDQFGFSSDNFIGATPQPNTWTDNWLGFFREQRLGHQFHLLADKGINFKEADQLLDQLDDFLPDNPPASLIHGDLWGGNKAFLADGTPVLFDPAVHYTDSECDIAMTELFGGFSRSFYQAYRANRPAPENADSLHEIYRLYHILNHAVLFGGGYVSQARSVLHRFI